MPPFPPLTRCYGWMRIDSNKLPRRFHKYRDLQPRLPPGYREVGIQYAMVYEYVPHTGEVDVDVAQAHFDFFHLAGFAVHELKRDNWIQGKLVDFCNLTSLVDPFALSRWKRLNARRFLGLPPQDQVEEAAANKDEEEGENSEQGTENATSVK